MQGLSNDEDIPIIKFIYQSTISTYGKSPHLKIIQKINHRLAQLVA